ncbi:hypothetical protein E1A85_17085 [Acinetobacter baumannii]|nr:hypothetical protein E1A85_17085 [Acinetobacter baumannii]
MPVKNIKTLILAMSTISLTGVVIPAHAATDAEVDALRKEVSELKTGPAIIKSAKSGNCSKYSNSAANYNCSKLTRSSQQTGLDANA